MFLNFFSLFVKKVVGYSQFEAYKNFVYLNYDELKLAVDYICRNLNSLS